MDAIGQRTGAHEHGEHREIQNVPGQIHHGRVEAFEDKRKDCHHARTPERVPEGAVLHPERL
eukprot:92-Eustigmatos_ZCMA.PRE.1